MFVCVCVYTYIHDGRKHLSIFGALSFSIDKRYKFIVGKLRHAVRTELRTITHDAIRNAEIYNVIVLDRFAEILRTCAKIASPRE